MRTIKQGKVKIVEKADANASSFESVTLRFLSSVKSNQIECPSCGNTIDFNKGVIWQGPDTFTCSNCERHLSMRLVHRALRDLGLET